MFLNSRRFSVWLVSFLAVLILYFIYNRLNRTPPIPSGSRQTVTLNADVNGDVHADVRDANSGVGMVGNVGVGAAKGVRYTKLNAQKQVEGEFGFEELLHQDGNDWEIEKPYYTAYRRGFKCTITGERAKVEVETSGGRVTPKQGIMTGNVKIHIWPQRNDGFGEAVIYLDDVAFTGDRSMFSTPGQVDFVSDKVRMAGMGMELIYNSDDDRLELLKISRLQSLRIKQWSRQTVFNSDTNTVGSPERGQPKQGAAKRGQEYKCVFDQNVVIDTPHELLMAQEVSISDILMTSSKADESGGQEQKVEQDKTESARADSGEKDRRAPAVASPGDVTVNCDGGIVVTPMDSAVVQKGKNERGRTPMKGAGQWIDAAVRGYKAMFSGEAIDYSAATGEATANGPSQIIFDANVKNDNGVVAPAIVFITAQKQARYEPALNIVCFEGNGRCTISQADGNATRQYIVTADKLEVDLAKKEGNSVPGSSLDARRLIASGGEVRLASTKKVDQHLLAGVEMKCVKMDYNVVDDNFLATGPGLIKVDNSQTDEPQDKLPRFSLRRKCYAFVRNFDSLAFSRGSNHITADSNDGSLLIDYLPVVAKGVEDKVAITASHVDANISQTPQGRNELVGLIAKGAVTYEDKDNQFAGSEFIYDTNGSVINVYGDKSRPCLLNGAIVDTIRYDLKTGRKTTRIKSPGALR